MPEDETGQSAGGPALGKSSAAEADRRAAAETGPSQFGDLMAQVAQVNGVNVLAAQVDVGSVDNLREMSDWFKDKVGSGVAVLATVRDGKPVIIARVTGRPDRARCQGRRPGA